MDPERNLKLYGDGFAEQRLIDDQILALTGRDSSVATAAPKKNSRR